MNKGVNTIVRFVLSLFCSLSACIILGSSFLRGTGVRATAAPVLKEFFLFLLKRPHTKNVKQEHRTTVCYYQIDLCFAIFII